MVTRTLWITVKGKKIRNHRKTKPSSKDLGRGEVPIKLKISWDADNMSQPTIEREVDISSAFQDLQVSDLEVEEPVITPEEMRLLQAKRKVEMAEMLRNQGFKVEPPEDVDPELAETLREHEWPDYEHPDNTHLLND